ncbi:MAG: hypothetical protein SCH71_12325 [Desulfobulbaceae bacterium]|nr:hypothetical protein [Desulfobulbaceae bacterium]
MQSKVEKQPGRFAGIRSTTSYEAQMIPAADRRRRSFTGELHNYYDEAISVIREAESILNSAFVNSDIDAADFRASAVNTGKKKQRSFRRINP